MASYQISVPEEKIATLKKKLSQATFPDEVGCLVPVHQKMKLICIAW